ncbi:MAG: transketolase family protein [Spirochaetia bacterium]|nr:transketolase family protein [Spirochaetia bacterium]
MKTAMRNTYGETLARLGAVNKNIVVLDADLAKSTQTAKFGKAFPDRFFDMGIAEADMICTAAGLAASGMNPFASTFAMFASGRAWEQVRNSVAYPNLPVKIVVTHAGISVGEDGPTHQACEDIAIMRAIPNMRVVAPADSIETESLITYLTDEYAGPIYVRLSRMNTEVMFKPGHKFEIGKGVIMKEGTDVTIISTGIILRQAVGAGELLKKAGISAEVIHMPSIKPIDGDMIIKSAQKTKKVVTIEEHNIIGGLGSAVAELLCENFPVKMKRLGMMDTFAESGTPDTLFEKYNLTDRALAKAAEEILKNR